MIPFATSAELIEQVMLLNENQHHAWGVKEMIGAGIEVSVLPQRCGRFERMGHDWKISDLRRYDMIYCNHNRLIRLPLQTLVDRSLPPLVSLAYAREKLLLPSRHFGLLCMTPTAMQWYEHLEKTRVRYAPWGIDPTSRLHQMMTTDGDYVLSTGVTGRDFPTLFLAAGQVNHELVIAARGKSLKAPDLANIRIVSDFVSPWDIRKLYEGAFAGLVVLERDDRKRSSMGWTNVLELMAVGLPIIKTRTGTLDDIVDIEEIGAGILVEPERPDQIASAIRRLRESSELRSAMGSAGAAYVRQHLTMDKFAQPLIELVEQAASQ